MALTVTVNFRLNSESHCFCWGRMKEGAAGEGPDPAPRLRPPGLGPSKDSFKGPLEQDKDFAAHPHTDSAYGSSSARVTMVTAAGSGR